MDLPNTTRAVAEGRELTAAEVIEIARALADPAQPAAAKETFLETLSRRGETPAEIARFADAFRGLARDPGLDRWSPVAIDVCGTGGDRSGSFNISTTVAFVLAAAAVPVVKHGNRSITSHCGSADLLEAIGIRIDVDAALAPRAMEELNFVFLFAPAYHPAFKEIGPVRRALAARGVRTIFNLLGPLLNPARPAFQVMGVFAEPLVPAVAAALDHLGLAAGYAVHGTDPEGRAYDELTVLGRNRAVGFGRLRGVDIHFEPQSLGLAPAQAGDLAGGDAAANAAILERVLAGTAPQGLIDSIVLNAAIALHVAGRSASIQDSLGDARELLLGGAVRDWLATARKFFAQ